MGVGYAPRHVVPRAAAAAATKAPTNYESSFALVRSSIECEYAERVAASEEREHLSYLTDIDCNASANKGATGRERLTRLNEALNSFGLVRSKNQRWFHRQMSMAIIRKLFKNDFTENIDFLREQFQVDDFKSEVMIITPRRWGKTYSVAMFVCACAYAIEGLDQAIFSTGRRASKKLLDLIYQFLCKLPGMKESIIVKNVETIHIQGPGGPDDVRKISSYPSKVRARARVTMRVGRARPLAPSLWSSYREPPSVDTRANGHRHYIERGSRARTTLPMDDVVEQLMKLQRCLHCGQYFSEREAVGANECRRHLGEPQHVYARYGGTLGTWTCCGVSDDPHSEHYATDEAALGCTPCDHYAEHGLPRNETVAYAHARTLFGDDLATRNVVYDARGDTITFIRVAATTR